MLLSVALVDVKVMVTDVVVPVFVAVSVEVAVMEVKVVVVVVMQQGSAQASAQPGIPAMLSHLSSATARLSHVTLPMHEALQSAAAHPQKHLQKHAKAAKVLL